MALSSTAGNAATVPGTDPIVLKAAETNLVRSGQQNKANLAALLSRPAPSNLRSHGSGIHINATG